MPVAISWSSFKCCMVFPVLIPICIKFNDISGCNTAWRGFVSNLAVLKVSYFSHEWLSKHDDNANICGGVLKAWYVANWTRHRCQLRGLGCFRLAEHVAMTSNLTVSALSWIVPVIIVQITPNKSTWFRRIDCNVNLHWKIMQMPLNEILPVLHTWNYRIQ